MGFQAGLYAFTAAVVGGIGNLPGAVLGGLVIGLAQSFSIGLPLVHVLRRDRLRDPDRGHDRRGRAACSGGRRCRRYERTTPAIPTPDERARASASTSGSRRTSSGATRRAGIVGVVQRELERVPSPAFYLGFGIVAALVPGGHEQRLRTSASASTRCSTCCSRSASTSSSATRACSTSATSRSTASARTATRCSPRRSSASTGTRSPSSPSSSSRPRSSGFLVALPSRRLLGDYLAIVTLFFGQLFVTVYQNGEAMSVLGFTRKYNVTGGPNGIPNVDNFHVVRLAASARSRPTTTSRSSSSSSCSPPCTSSTSRAPAARGSRCARIRSPPS